jgi:hypothetical protein
MDPGSVSFVTRQDGGAAISGGPGDVFVKSAGYQRISDPAGRGQSWSTGPVEVSKAQFTLLTKGTILETTAGGPGGGMVPPMYQPGVVDKLFEPLGVRDVFGQSTTTASQTRYVVEGTALSGAAGVADAERLCDAGWLERRTVDNTDDVAFFWTRQAEGALDMNALRRTDPADLN